MKPKYKYKYRFEFKDFPDFKTLREMIEYGHAHKDGGDNPQYIFKEKKQEKTKTYNEVWYDTVGLGQYLYKNGLCGKKVAILSENSYQWIACFYSIITGKYICLPLDAKLMDDDLVDIMIRSQCDAIYYTKEFDSAIEKMKSNDEVVISHYIKIEDFDKLIAEGHADLDAGNPSYLDNPPAPEDLATIVFTSGTTGKSKGVMLSHKNVCASAVASARVIQGDHAIGFLPMNHTFAWASALFLSNVFHAWGYICPSLKTIPQDMKDYHPENLAGVPLLVEMIYKTIWKTAEKSGRADKLKKGIKISNFLLKFGIDVRRKLFKEVINGVGGELDYIVIGGAYLDPKYEKGMEELGIPVLGAYGTTECSPGVTISTLEEHKVGSCGKPMLCCQVKINNPDEDGVGEIFVKGDNVMVGYYNDPEATASVFDGDWFKTGDYGYMDDEGYLYFVGRKKNLIVLGNGKNVAPEELEDKLTSKIEYIREVLVYEDDADVIAAEFYLNTDEYPDAKERLKADVDAVNKELPTYKRIRKISTRDTEFEKTTTLKIKRKYKDEVNA
ncbi:MAG: AMP-binding protein [Acutalibacteraceae bacterium]